MNTTTKIKYPKFRTPYDGFKYRFPKDNLDANGEEMPSKTEQCHKDLCDIHKIIRTYDKTKLLSHVNEAVARYGDYTEVNEFKQSLDLVIDAQKTFAELPSHVRKRFGNDPGAFFEFATNPENKTELIKMGLATPIRETPEVIQKVEIVNNDENKETLLKDVKAL